MNRVRRALKSQPGPVLDTGETWKQVLFNFNLFTKIVQDEKADEEFPTGRQDVPAERDTLRRSPQQDPTQDLWVRWVHQSRPEETSLAQAVLVFDAISRSRGCVESTSSARQKAAGPSSSRLCESWPCPHRFEQVSLAEGDFQRFITCLRGNCCPECL